MNVGSRSGSRGSYESGTTRMRMTQLDLNRLQRCMNDRHLHKGVGRKRREMRRTGIFGDINHSLPSI